MIQTHFQCESQIGILIDCLFEIGDSDYALTKHVYEFLDIIIDTWDASIVHKCSAQLFTGLLSRIIHTVQDVHYLPLKQNWMGVLGETLIVCIDKFPLCAFLQVHPASQLKERDFILCVLIQVMDRLLVAQKDYGSSAWARSIGYSSASTGSCHLSQLVMVALDNFSCSSCVLPGVERRASW